MPTGDGSGGSAGVVVECCDHVDIGGRPTDGVVGNEGASDDDDGPWFEDAAFEFVAEVAEAGFDLVPGEWAAAPLMGRCGGGRQGGARR